ncbi:hypothetical protein GsuE55_19090 [Geobacillus subterraneus]|uniref:Uncharacterized protein n=1 Tax=Geobacillus subterraneus TaxID=129338 RepID=A0A679FTN0_9BACL|nr:hypothetical protein GsuE55_19090 [Geobacillus subterraneus]
MLRHGQEKGQGLANTKGVDRQPEGVMTISAHLFVAWHGKLVIFRSQSKGTNRCLDGNECRPS